MLKEEWNKYKDLEYYPDRVCKCGCGGRIKVKPHHKYNGIPEYICGHNPQSEEGKRRIGEHQSKLHKGKPRVHPEDCQCPHCKSKRGEHSGEDAPNWQGGMIEVICLYCGEKKEVHIYRKDVAKYCSKDCADKDRVGRYAGPNSPSWKGGISNLPYPFEFNEEFKTLIRERDNNTCQLCDKTKEQEGRNLCVHHIYYDKENDCSDESDFTTLCDSCNTKVNFNREYWIEFFQSKLLLVL